MVLALEIGTVRPTEWAGDGREGWRLRAYLPQSRVVLESRDRVHVVDLTVTRGGPTCNSCESTLPQPKQPSAQVRVPEHPALRPAHLLRGASSTIAAVCVAAWGKWRWHIALVGNVPLSVMTISDRAAHSSIRTPSFGRQQRLQ